MFSYMRLLLVTFRSCNIVTSFVRQNTQTKTVISRNPTMFECSRLKRLPAIATDSGYELKLIRESERIEKPTAVRICLWPEIRKG